MPRRNEPQTRYVSGGFPGQASGPSDMIPSPASGENTYCPRVAPSTSRAGAGEVYLSAEMAPKRTVKKTGVADALDVASYLVHLAACEPEPEFLSHMRLQKLLYYTQGWSLALRDRPMFSDRIEAWAHGPVVRDLYPQFAPFGEGPIAPETVGSPQSLSPDDREFIESVWEAYKAYSGSSLRAMTHGEQPWKDARGSCGPADRCTTEITQDAMGRFFKQVYKSRAQAS